jgi:hypothetical protein
MKTTTTLAACLYLSGVCIAQAPLPQNGYVADEKTAIKIAEGVLPPIYGEKQIGGERPFNAKLQDGVWLVPGSIPQGWVGGAAEIRFDKKTGKILGHIH